MEVKDSGVDGGTVCMVMFSFPETGLGMDSGIFGSIVVIASEDFN